MRNFAMMSLSANRSPRIGFEGLRIGWGLRMSALAMAPGQADHKRVADEFQWSSTGLSGFLAATADRHPHRMAFKDQPGRDAWSGRPKIEWTYPFASEIIGRLVAFFSGLGLAPGSPVGVCLPNGSEACLTILAIEQAGLIPCLLSLSWSEQQVAEAIEAAHVQTVVTQGAIEAERPAEAFCRLAARYFGLRFVCSFGPLVPDGVIDLDRVLLNGETAEAASLPGADIQSGIVTFSRQGAALRPVFRPCQSTMAAAVTFLATAKFRPGDRILSFLAPDDHRGIVTGLVASLLSGATLECHGLFQARALAEALRTDVPTHLVVPGWMEDSLVKANLPASVASVVLVHEAPVRFKAKRGLKRQVIDVLAFGELALLTRARDAGGQFALSLEDDGPGASPTGRNLLRIQRAEDGSISLGGLSADIRDFEAGQPMSQAPRTEWQPSGFKADLFAGIVIGVS